MSFKNLSKESREKALVKARQIRKSRAELKKSLKKGRTDLKSIFFDERIFKQIANMKLVELVSSLPGMGRERAERILVQELGISLSKRAGGLGKKQRQRFLNYFKIS
ncbi:MAG: integration host factor, actinobacterial type [Actinomycetota bacterium]